MRSAIAPSTSTSAWFAFRASGVKRGNDVAEVRLVKRRVLVDLAGEEAFAERAERDEADAELLERRHDLRLGLSPPQRVLALQRRDRLDRVGATDRLDTGFGQTEVPDLAFADQLLDGAGDVLDRHFGIDAVLVEAGR